MRGDDVIGVANACAESMVWASREGITLHAVCMRRRAGSLVAGVPFCPGVRTRRETFGGEESRSYFGNTSEFITVLSDGRIRF
jgi:hypothetical protein